MNNLDRAKDIKKRIDFYIGKCEAGYLGPQAMGIELKKLRIYAKQLKEKVEKGCGRDHYNASGWFCDSFEHLCLGCMETLKLLNEILDSGTEGEKE